MKDVMMNLLRTKDSSNEVIKDPNKGNNLKSTHWNEFVENVFTSLQQILLIDVLEDCQHSVALEKLCIRPPKTKKNKI